MAAALNLALMLHHKVPDEMQIVGQALRLHSSAGFQLCPILDVSARHFADAWYPVP